jgi:hypothetical protein
MGAENENILTFGQPIAPDERTGPWSSSNENRIEV